MLDAIAVCNKALLMLGADPITALTDSTDRARLCNGLYDAVRQRVYRSHPWNSLRVAFDFTSPGMHAKTTGPNLTITANYASYTGTTLTGNCALALAQSNVPAVLTTGSFYFEAEILAVPASGTVEIGIASTENALTQQLGTGAQQWAYVSSGGKRSGGTTVSYGASYTKGDRIGCLFSFTDAALTFYKNGVSQGLAFGGVAATAAGYLLPAMGITPASVAGGSVRGRFLASEWLSTPTGASEWPAVAFDGEWRYSIHLPEACMRVVAVTSLDGYGLDWKIRGRLVLCDEPAVQVRYCHDQTAIAALDPSLADCLAAAMAAEMAYAITRSTSKEQAAQAALQQALQVAKSIDGMEETPEEADDFPLIRARRFA